MKKAVYEEACHKALEYFERAQIVLTESEKENLEVADFGLDDLERTGLQLVTYVNTARCCAKEDSAIITPFPRARPSALITVGYSFFSFM